MTRLSRTPISMRDCTSRGQVPVTAIIGHMALSIGAPSTPATPPRPTVLGTLVRVSDVSPCSPLGQMGRILADYPSFGADDVKASFGSPQRSRSATLTAS